MSMQTLALPDTVINTNELLYQGKHNGMVVAPLWQEYHWSDILNQGIENAAEGTLIAKADNVTLKNGKSGELKIEVLVNHIINEDFFKENNVNFASSATFWEGDHCLALQVTHGDARNIIVMRMPNKGESAQFFEENKIEVKQFLEDGIFYTDDFDNSGIGHVALSFIKQLALHEGLDISLKSVSSAKEFYLKEKFVKSFDQDDMLTKMEWQR